MRDWPYRGGREFTAGRAAGGVNASSSTPPLLASKQKQYTGPESRGARRCPLDPRATDRETLRALQLSGRIVRWLVGTCSRQRQRPGENPLAAGIIAAPPNHRLGSILRYPPVLSEARWYTMATRETVSTRLETAAPGVVGVSSISPIAADGRGGRTVIRSRAGRGRLSSVDGTYSRGRAG